METLSNYIVDNQSTKGYHFDE